MATVRVQADDVGSVWSDVPSSNPKTAYSFYGSQVYDSWGSVRHNYLKFTMPASLGTITQIDLVYTTNATQTAITQNLYTANSWTYTGTTMTWNNKNGYSGSIIHSATNPTTAETQHIFNLQGNGATNPLSKTWGDTILLACKNASEVQQGWKGISAYGGTDDTAGSDTTRTHLLVTYTPSASPFTPHASWFM